jgi:hypothetical protein
LASASPSGRGVLRLRHHPAPAPFRHRGGRDGSRLLVRQQGSIIVFVVLIFFYAWRMNRLDREFGVDEEG